MRISDWSSDVCSSDLAPDAAGGVRGREQSAAAAFLIRTQDIAWLLSHAARRGVGSFMVHNHRGRGVDRRFDRERARHKPAEVVSLPRALSKLGFCSRTEALRLIKAGRVRVGGRSEEHTSELKSLIRISYAVFCLKKQKSKKT